MENTNVSLLTKCDNATALQLSFQDPATPIMEGIFLFNAHLTFVILGIVVLVAWILSAVLVDFSEFESSRIARFNHAEDLEIIWTTRV